MVGPPSTRDTKSQGDSPFTCRGPSRGYGRARSHDPTVVSTSPPGVISQAGGAARRPTRPPGRKHPPQPGDVWVPSPPPCLRGWGDPVSVHSIIHQARACKFAAGVRVAGRWRVRCATLCLACRRVPCRRFRGVRARVPGRVATMPWGIVVVRVCSSVWQRAECCVAHGAMWCNVWLVRPVWRRTCMCGGQPAISRAAPRACWPA